jgi:hypothetical protein
VADPTLFDRYSELRKKVGLTATQAADQMHISPTTMNSYEKRLRHERGAPVFLDNPPDGIIDDFARFRERYFKRMSTPWQADAAMRIQEMLKRPEKTYVVINVAPGSGKSTLFTHDIPAWLAARDPHIRGLVGSRTERQAAQYTGRLRRSFGNERSAFVQELGPFRPLQRDLWRNSEFIIAVPDDEINDEKEPTFSAYGQDSGFLGGRYDFVIWDDLVDFRNAKSIEAREQLINWYETEAITRLEPGGLFVLQGQRIGADDLYRYSLDLVTGDDSDERPLFEHIIYRAHYEDRCEGHHSIDAPAWPEGCLLDPVRLPWRELRSKEKNQMERFLVLYQQEDIDPDTSLVKHLWLEGGIDKDGTLCPGCWDEDRSLQELPRGINLNECVMIASVDPSAARHWALQMWLYHPESKIRWLIDHYRGPLTAPGFLDRVDGEFLGFLPTWQEWSIDVGLPISTWVVEANTTQRFLLQYQHSKDFMVKYGINIIPHQTTQRRHDPEYGVQALAPGFKYGRIRLPGRSRHDVKPFTDELTKWPHARTEDTVMAAWFIELYLPNAIPANQTPIKFWRPSWTQASDRGLHIGSVR